MPWTTTLFELIDMRSFSNLWFWIALAVLWSTTAYYVIGVPFDMVVRAQKKGGAAADDLMDLARIKITRLLDLVERSGDWLAGGIAFVLTALVVLSVRYGVEFAQAVLLLVGPQLLVHYLAVRAARAIRAANPESDQLCAMLIRHRVHRQLIGMAAIFVTAMWGMWVNLALPGWY